MTPATPNTRETATTEPRNRVGVFSYNFKHWKSQATIQNLILGGYKPAVIFASDPVKLDFYQSKIRVSPKDLFLWHPRHLAEIYDIPYHVVEHNSEETSRYIEDYNLDIGVIAGARILKPIAFNNFRLGVLNSHPGLLPQGVTVHLIDSYIDKGLLVEQQPVNVYRDDTMVELTSRLQNLGQKLMLDGLRRLEHTRLSSLQKLEEGFYHKPVPPHIEASLEEKFKEYKENKQ